jgi:two-component system nitrogen regulation response regulator NtrX
MAIQGPAKILLIDDELAILESFSAALLDEGYDVQVCSNPLEAIELGGLLEVWQPDCIFLDVWMPQIDGLKVLKEIKEKVQAGLLAFDVSVIVMSGHANIATAVKATKLGAFDFLEKPVSLEKALVLIENAQALQRLRAENQTLKQQVRHQQQKEDVFIGRSEVMLQVQQLVRRVAPTTGAVLITGENGTGKELIAKQVHQFSLRKNEPFVAMNCAAIPDALIESELFGYEKGAFTGATQQKRGKFDLAHKGTLFLDEIGDMSLPTQAKILRVLQDQRFERLGGQHSFDVDVRVIAATNKDLSVALTTGQFREDLFYRLNVLPIHVPPLRHRKQDIAPLVEYYMQQAASLYHQTARKLSAGAIEVLANYPWPGNVRELKNWAYRFVVLGGDQAGLQNIALSGSEVASSLVSPLSLAGGGVKNTESKSLTAKPHVSLRQARIDFEKEYILHTLEENAGNVARAAQVLGLEPLEPRFFSLVP